MTFCNIFSYAYFSFEPITVFVWGFCITSGFRGVEILVCKEHLLLSGVFFNLENSFEEEWVLFLVELI